MISVKKLWDRLSVLSKTGTAGYFSQDDFNSNLYSVQYTVLGLLCDNYENNQKLSDYMVEQTKELPFTSLANGSLFQVPISDAIPDYYRLLSVKYVNGSFLYPCQKVNVNEEARYLTSPVRKFDLSKQRTGYIFKNNNIFTMPYQAGNNYSVIYARKPLDAYIAFTIFSTDDSDYLEYDETNSVDISFHEGLFNLFLYLMLESLGIEQKENLIQQYSQLGINREVKLETK